LDILSSWIVDVGFQVFFGVLIEIGVSKRRFMYLVNQGKIIVGVSSAAD
jgi:hypothetical protein